MEVQIAIAKTTKYGSEESGDTIEVVERPAGGISAVLCDGKNSGHTAKTISSMVVRKVISLLAEGVRDGAAARAASDFLFTEREGKVGVYLNILSADLQTGTLVLTRNNPAPVFLAQGDRVECLNVGGEPIGLARNIRPTISEVPLESGTTVVMYTDGVANAGQEVGGFMDICTMLEALLDEQQPSAQWIADNLLSEAIRLDQNRPSDDMSVLVLRVMPDEVDDVRRMVVRYPIHPDKQTIN
ncbi:MAG TPA: SpoIIE family protein phosphatase [Chloroflexi bacterium]|jgi:hypothetical protein|nr:SpoIIE family protein phosphatase [Chloroflexota bacterium]